MSKSRKYIIAAVIAVLIVSGSFAGCKTLLSVPVIGVSTSDTIGMTGKIIDDITEMADKHGYSLEVSNASGNSSAQSLAISTFIEDKVTVLAVCPVNEADLATSLADAAKAGIPVVLFDKNLSSADNTAYFAGYDAAGEGKAAAQAIAENDNGKSNVVIEIVGPEDNPNAVAASKAFHEVIDLVTNIKVVKVYSEWSPSVAASGLTSALSRYPEASAIYSSNSTLDASISEVLDKFGLNKKVDESGHIYRVSVGGSKNGYTGAVDGYIDLLIVTNVDELSASLFDALTAFGSGKEMDTKSSTASFTAIPQGSVESSQNDVWGFLSDIE